MVLQRIAGFLAALALAAMPAKAATIFKEAGGQVVIEAEHFTERTSNADGARWHIVPDDGPTTTTPYINARGNSYAVSLPDAGLNHNVGEDALNTPPFIDYKVNITTTGDYVLWMRWGGWDGASDSIYAQIVELNTTTPRWYRFARSIGGDFASAVWDSFGAVDDNTAGGAEVSAQWTISTPGTYTIRITQREDGSGLDAFALRLSSLGDPGNPGPAESDLQEGFLVGAPDNQTALPPNTATFTAQARTGPGATVTYQWQSKAPAAADFSDIAGATSASYTTPATTVAMNGTQYRYVATSGGTTLTSGAATLTTDNTPPAIVHAFSGPAATQLTITFTERLDSATATTAGNYVLSGGLTVSTAVLSADGKTVILKTSAQTASTAYTVTVNGVKDTAGNTLTGGVSSFKGPVQVAGQLLARKFEGIAGTAVNALLTSPRYPDSPTSFTYWDVFGPFPGTGDNLGDNYGIEVTGFIVPKVTATYEFYLRSDDASQLLLSTDETAANARQIAFQGGCCNAYTHQPGILSSQPIDLVAGNMYYVRAYVKEGGGGDFLYVGWRNSVDDGDITVPPEGEIPGEFLATGYDPSGSVTITQQPANATVPENSPVTFSVAYTAYSPLLGTGAQIQWQKAAAGGGAFADIVGATGTSFSMTFASAADNGAQYRAVLTSGDVTATSDAATLTISGSVPIITLPKTIEHRYWNNILVNSISTLRTDPRFPNAPTMITFEPLFEYGPNGSNEAGSTYGNRISGWIKAPEDGEYIFFTCSDDPSELWLSTNEDPANKKLIANENIWSNARSWQSSGGGSDLTAKRSDQFQGTQWPTKNGSGGATITLQAGKHYYVEVLHTEGTGGDNVGVAWKKPSDAAEPQDTEPPISADFIDQLFAITGNVTFGTQPQNQSTAANTSVTFTAAATATDGSPLTLMWQTAPAGSTDFVAAGGTGGSFTTPLLGPGDQGRQYRVLAFGPGGAGLSSIATVTVSQDTVPPTITYFNATRTSAQIVFSEPLDQATAEALTSYSLSGGGSVTAAALSTVPSGAGMVTLTLDGLTATTSYTLTIKDVKDTANLPIVQTTRDFVAYDINADFNGPVSPVGATVTGTANLKSSGSFDGSGFVELTANVGSAQGTIGFADTLNAGDATKITAQFKIYVGNGSGNPADGFSFNVAGDIDSTTVNTGEEGAGGGLTIAFDTYDNAGGEAPAIDVKWGGAVVATTVGSPTPVVKATLVNNQWVDIFIQLIIDTAGGVGHVTVVHNNVKYYDNLEIPGATAITAPQVAIGARTGGEFERHWIDNLVVAYNADIAPPQPPTIAITSPANNAELTAGSAVPITVNAVASAGVNKVEFFANGSKLGESTVAPYTFTVPAAPAGIYSVTAKITDNAAVSVTSAPVLVTVRPPASANAKKVLFVHATAGPNASNLAEANHMFGLGYDVYMAPALPSVTEDANGKALVMISSTVGSGDVADKFRDVTTPVMLWENALEDNFLLTLNDTAVDRNTIAAQTSIDILPGAVGHKLAAGLSGTVVVTTAATDLSWGKPTSSATLIATVAGDATKNTIYAVEPGGLLIDGTSTATGRRVYFMMADSTFLLLTANGLALFNAALDYAVNGPGGGPQPAQLSVSVAANSITITWTNGGTLEWTNAIVPGGTWTSTNDSDGSYTEAIDTAQNKYFRVKN